MVCATLVNAMAGVNVINAFNGRTLLASSHADLSASRLRLFLLCGALNTFAAEILD